MPLDYALALNYAHAQNYADAGAISIPPPPHRVTPGGMEARTGIEPVYTALQAAA